jgi:hypothetical protein
VPRAQVHKAFEYLSKSSDADEPLVRYAASVKRSDSALDQRGVYARRAGELAAAATYNVTLTPHAHRDADVRGEKLKVEDRLLLRKKARPCRF